MREWETPEICELNISETSHKFFGNSRDGGWLGDSSISGHLEWSDDGGILPPIYNPFEPPEDNPS